MSHKIKKVNTMFLLLNAITASLDGLIIGIGLRMSKTLLSKKDIVIIFIGNFLIYTFFLTLYYYFQLTFMTKTLTTLLYIFLGFNSLRNEESIHFEKNKLTFLNCILITFTHSLDGTMVSLSFVYNYKILHIVSIFSLMSLIILLLGYYFAKIFTKSKKNYVSVFLFWLLALINQFF